MDRGSWQAAVHRVTKNQTRLKRPGTHIPGMLALWLWMSNFSFSIYKWGCIKINTVPHCGAVSWGLNEITSRGSPGLMEWNQLQMRLLDGNPRKVALLQVCRKQRNGSDFLWLHPVLCPKTTSCLSAGGSWSQSKLRLPAVTKKKKKKRLPAPRD